MVNSVIIPTVIWRTVSNISNLVLGVINYVICFVTFVVLFIATLILIISANIKNLFVF